MDTTSEGEATVPLSELVLQGRHEELQRRIEAGTNVDEEDPTTGDTAMDAACSRLLINTVQYLLDHGADCNKQHRTTGSTPLYKLVTSPLGLAQHYSTHMHTHLHTPAGL